MVYDTYPAAFELVREVLDGIAIPPERTLDRWTEGFRREYRDAVQDLERIPDICSSYGRSTTRTRAASNTKLLVGARRAQSGLDRARRSTP